MRHVDMHRGDNKSDIRVLDFIHPLGELPLMVVEAVAHHGERLGIPPRQILFRDDVAENIPEDFRAVAVIPFLHQAVELDRKIVIKRNREALHRCSASSSVRDAFGLRLDRILDPGALGPIRTVRKPVKCRVKSEAVDLMRNEGADPGLRVVRDAESRVFQHLHVVPAVAHRDHVTGRDAALRRELLHNVTLAVRIHNLPAVFYMGWVFLLSEQQCMVGIPV